MKFNDIKSKKLIATALQYIMSEATGGKNNLDITNTAQYDAIDMTADLKDISGNTIRTYAIECKDRKCNSYTYDTAMLEQSKYESLSNSGKDRKLYVNTYADDIMYVWNVEKITPKYHTYFAPKTTDGDTQWSRRKVHKKCIELDFNEAVLKVDLK